MFRSNLCTDLITEIQKSSPDFYSLYARWINADFYMMLGENNVSASQLCIYKNEHARRVQVALQQANLHLDQLNAMRSVARLIDHAFKTLIEINRNAFRVTLPKNM